MDLASRRRCAAFRLGARRACVWWWQTIHPSFSTSTEEARSLSPAFPVMKRGVLSVVGVAGRAAVVVAESAPDAKLYAVRGRGARVSSLGTGRNVWPVSDGRSVWVQSVVDRSRCALRQVGLDRRKISAPRAFPCATRSDPAGGSLGLVVSRTRVLDPLTGRTVLKTRWGILAVAGGHVLLAGPGKHFTLIDAATRSQRRLPWPSILTGLDRPAVDPRGRSVAVAFAVPAWNGGAGSRRVAARHRDRAADPAARHACIRVAQAHEHGLDRRRPTRAARRKQRQEHRRSLAARPATPRRKDRGPTRTHQRQRLIRAPQLTKGR
jgi:hypothetical protein